MLTKNPASLLLACVTLSVLRVSMASGATTSESASNAGELGEILVTAQRRSESIMSVPVAVTAFTAEGLKNLQIEQPADLAGHVAGLQVSSPTGDSGPIFAIRGISENDYSPNQAGPIAVYTNGVYAGGVNYLANQTFDLDRVEVLRGPQGTLYGRNATGGAINFITVTPDFTTGGYLTARVGNYGRWETEGAYQTALNDQWAVRVAGNWIRSNGYERNDATGQTFGGTHASGGRITLVYKPNDRVEATLRLSTGQFGNDPYAIGTRGAGVSGYDGGTYPLYQWFASIPQVAGGFNSFCSNGLDNRTTTAKDNTALGASRYSGKTNQYSLDLLVHATSTMDIVSITSYGRGDYSTAEDADQTARALFADAGGVSGNQLSEDLRIQSSGKSALRYIAGLYYSKDSLDWHDAYTYFADIDFNGDGTLDNRDCQWSLANGYAPYGCVQANSFTQDRKSTAAYADLTFDLNEIYSLRAGLRYTRDQITVSNYTADILGTDLVPLVNTIPGTGALSGVVADPLSKTWSNLTGRFGVDIHLAGGGLLYSTLSTGYRAGSANGQAFNGPDEVTIANPEKLTALEVGVKSYAFDRRVSLTGEVFYYRYTDQQALNVDPATFKQTEVNLAKSHLYGAELEAAYTPDENFRIAANVAVLRSKVDEATVSGVDISGNELVLAPSFTGNLSVGWTFGRSESGAFKGVVDESYTGKQWMDLFNDPTIASAGHALTNARLSYAFSHLPLTVSAWGKNLTNKTYVTAATNVSGLGFDYFHLGQPRTYGLEANWRF